MNLHLAETNDNPNLAAVMYGPLVLAGVMGTENMTAPAPFSDPSQYNDYYTYDYHVPANLQTSLRLDRKNLKDYIEKQKGLVFNVKSDNIRLEPIYKIHRQRYVVYWNIVE